MRTSISLFLLLFFVNFNVTAQKIAAFSDYQNRFYIFDDGTFRQMEHLPVLSFQMGEKSVGYITNNNHFKIYYNNIDYEIGPFITEYFVTNHLVVYKADQQLYVFENGKRSLLTKLVGSYYYGDSIVAYYDREKYMFQVYYRGKIFPLADGLLSEDIASFRAGQNILGFIDTYDVFKVFYNNKITSLFTVNSAVIAKFGLDVVAYVDPDTEYLQAFYKGKILELETFRPKSFKVGYGAIAYITDLGDFKLFSQGEMFDISAYPPDDYTFFEDMLVYQQQGQFFAFYNGQEYLIENYIPTSYKCKFGSMVYIDQNGNLKLFKNGETEVLSYEKINDYEVLRNLVIYNTGMNTTKIYYQGKTYTQ